MMKELMLSRQVAKDLRIDCFMYLVGDPQIPIFEIHMTWKMGEGKSDTVWQETFGSAALANAFLRGVQSALPPAVQIPSIIRSPGGWDFSTTLTLETSVNDPTPVYHGPSAT